MEKINAIITGVGGYIPDYVPDDGEPPRMIGTNDEWITTRVGIKERHILREGGLGTSYLTRKAAKQLTQRTRIDPDTIDAPTATITVPDYKFPFTASIVLSKLGLKNAFAYDLETVCCGLMYALSTAYSFMENGRCKRVIVTGTGKMSSLVGYQDRQTYALLGGGTAAVLVEVSEDGELGVQGMFFRTDGKGFPFLHMKTDDSVCPASHFVIDHHLHYLYQEGRSVFRYAVADMNNDVLGITKRNDLSAGDAGQVVPHETNLRTIEAVVKHAELPMDKVAISIQHYGNTSVATIPLTFWDYESKLKEGDNVISTAFGAGFTHRVSLFKWAHDGADAVTRK